MAFAVSISVKRIAAASAPSMEQLKSQLRLAVVKGLIQRSAAYANIRIITKERTKDGLNKKSTFCALLIQDIFGFSELNKVASCMGILLIYLYSIFPINE